MNKKQVIASILIILVIVFRGPIFVMINIMFYTAQYSVIAIKGSIVEKIALPEHTEMVKEWVKEECGEVVSEVVNIKYIGKQKSLGEGSEFRLEAPFADGFIIANKNEEKVAGGFFIENDDKFHHLYSEWIKKETGIEDENIKLNFTDSFSDPYVEFDKITNLSEDCREIFENTHKLYMNTININNIDTLTDDNCIEFFNKVKNEIYYKVTELIGKPQNGHSLFIYTDEYSATYDFPEDELFKVWKKDENGFYNTPVEIK